MKNEKVIVVKLTSDETLVFDKKWTVEPTKDNYIVTKDGEEEGFIVPRHSVVYVRKTTWDNVFYETRGTNEWINKD